MEIEMETVDSNQPPPSWLARIKQVAVLAAHQAGQIQLATFRRQNDASHIRLQHDVKLETDRHCEQAVIGVIREAFPDHGILSEESGWLPGSGEAFWIIDPLDGTVNFWHGLPFFCVSIACYYCPEHLRGKAIKSGAPLDLSNPVVGVVFLPCTHELFVGSVGKGAFVNDRSFRIPTLAATAEAVVSVSFGKKPEIMNRMTGRLHQLLPRVHKARCLGAAAAEICYAACGYLGGVYYESLNPWDFAAGSIIIKEAGGFIDANEIEPGQWQVLAGASGIRRDLRSILGM